MEYAFRTFTGLGLRGACSLVLAGFILALDRLSLSGAPMALLILTCLVFLYATERSVLQLFVGLYSPVVRHAFRVCLSSFSISSPSLTLLPHVHTSCHALD